MKLAKNCELLDGEPCSACKDYMAIEIKISAAKKALEELLLERSKIRSRVNQNHDRLVRRLPVEIVGHVFKFCVPADADLDVFYSEGHYGIDDRWMLSSPLLLGKICNAWRKIAWGMPPLWTVFRSFLNDPEIHPHCVELSREWLERAGQLPLSIRVSHRKNNPHSTTTQIIDLINERSKRWKTVDIIGPPWLIAALGGNELCGAPNLRSLKIAPARREWRSEELRPFTPTNTRLRPLHLRIHNYCFTKNHIDWKQLTTVFLSQTSLDETIELLRRSPGVVYYKLYEIREDTGRYPKPTEAILYGALESLEIGCPPVYPSQSAKIITFFENFIFPNLRHLKLQTGKTERGEPLSWAPVITQITNSCPPLTSLAIQYPGPYPFTKTIPILQISPLLQNLEILEPMWRDAEQHREEVIQFFKLVGDTSLPKDTEPSFLPNLQSITLTTLHEDWNEDDAKKFWTYIPSIFGPISDIHNPRRRPLRKLRVRFVGDCFEMVARDIVLPLSKLQEQGVVVEFVDESNESLDFSAISGTSS